MPDEGTPVDSGEFYDGRCVPTAAAEALETAGVDATMRRERGDSADEILAVAEEIDAD